MPHATPLLRIAFLANFQPQPPGRGVLRVCTPSHSIRPHDVSRAVRTGEDTTKEGGNNNSAPHVNTQNGTMTMIERSAVCLQCATSLSLLEGAGKTNLGNNLPKNTPINGRTRNPGRREVKRGSGAIVCGSTAGRILSSQSLIVLCTIFYE